MFLPSAVYELMEIDHRRVKQFYFNASLQICWHRADKLNEWIDGRVLINS